MSVVQTVLGPISPSHLGRTLTHEHLALDLEDFYCPPPSEYKPFLDKKISLETVGYVCQYPYSNLDNMQLNDDAARIAIKKDIELFKQFGGSSIVENTSIGLNRNFKTLVDIQRETGVNLIAGTGHYVHEAQSAVHLSMTIEEMTDLYSKEISTGVDVPNVGPVKCGFIGEVGSSYPLHEFEKRAVRATGEAQEILGCGVSFHPGRSPKAPFDIVRMYLEAGGRAEKCVMSHLEITIMDVEDLIEFAELGTYMQYDLFGMECSFFQPDPSVDMPSDAQRINNLMLLIEDGWVNKLLLSQDIHSKHRLTSYGGHGYHHLHMNILPRLYAKGPTVDQVEQMTVTNPANWLRIEV